MDRRGFLGTLAGGLLARPFVARAQQTGNVYRVGLLTMGTITPENGMGMWGGFLDAMGQLGYVEGSNLVVRRAAVGGQSPERLPGLVAGLLQDGVDIIVTTSTRETQAAKRATATVPIVMTLSPDPVARGKPGPPRRQRDRPHEPCAWQQSKVCRAVEGGRAVSATVHGRGETSIRGDSS